MFNNFKDLLDKRILVFQSQKDLKKKFLDFLEVETKLKFSEENIEVNKEQKFFKIKNISSAERFVLNRFLNQDAFLDKIKKEFNYKVNF